MLTQKFAIIAALTLLALGIPAHAGSPYPNCADYEFLNTYELGGGIKLDSDGRFVLYVPNGLMDYVVWDEPSMYGFPERLAIWHGYVEDNGVPDLQRHDEDCMQVPWWDADTQVW